MPTRDKVLQKKWRDDWYYANKDKQIARQMQRRKELYALLKRYKGFLSCTDCRMSFRGRPECCDFHHVNPAEKEGDLKTMISSSKSKMKKELVKCIPLCANCHRTRHKHGCSQDG